MTISANNNTNMKIYLLDNFDSFTYNLVDQFRTLGFTVIIYRNDISAEFIADKMLKEQTNTLLVLSPGPGNPSSAGCMLSLINLVAGKVPILGICLGHQALVQHYGGTVDIAPTTVHGKASPINHNSQGIFEHFASPLPVARYHSLIATKVPNCLDVIAYTDELPMAIKHKKHQSIGFQFHPESILTTEGSRLLAQTFHFLSANQEQTTSSQGGQK